MLLAIDTSTQVLSIALHDGEALLAEHTMRAGRRHSALLAPLVEQMLSQLEISADDLSALAVAVGPGSYTGVRIGVALAKGMAAARNLPLAPVSTLEIMVAAQGHARADATLIATVAAGRDRVIWAPYREARGAWAAQGPPQIDRWAELIASCKGPTLISGEISVAARAEIRAAQDAGARIETRPAAANLRRAGFLAEIAWRRLRAPDAGAFPAERVMPLYLKSPG